MNSFKKTLCLTIGFTFLSALFYLNTPATAEDFVYNTDGIKTMNFDDIKDMKTIKTKPKKSTKRKKVSKTRYTIEETTELMSSSDIGDIKLDHDDHVYKCMKISKEGKDLKGALNALVAFQTKFGDTLDDDEVKLFIELSKLDTKLYKQVAHAAEEVGKEKTSIEENALLVKTFKNGKGKILLQGLQLAKKCNYDMENDYFSKDRVNLLIKLGAIKNKKRFMNIYEAMTDVGMDDDTGYKSLEFLYKVNTIKGKIAKKITNYLKENEWSSREQPGAREYEVIRDLMEGDYAAFYGSKKKRSGKSYYSKKKLSMR